MKQHARTLGQVFLHDHNILKKIIQFSNLAQGSNVIEIGCGKGALTQYLAQKNHVSVIEIDDRWIHYVMALKLPNVHFIHHDALTVDYSQFSNGCPVVANIPYHITTPLIIALAQAQPQLGPITIMIQDDVAKRILSQPGTKSYGALSIFCAYHFNITNGFFVSRQCFQPIPNVDSYVLKPVSYTHLTLPTT